MKDRSRAAEEAADNSIGFGGDDLKESDEIRTNESFWSVSQTDRSKLKRISTETELKK